MSNSKKKLSVKVAAALLASALLLQTPAASAHVYAETATEDENSDVSGTASTSESEDSSEADTSESENSSEAGTSSGDSEKKSIADTYSVDAPYALLVDLETGKVLYEKNADEICYPASTTKIMTALLVLDAIDRGDLSLDQVYTVTDKALEEWIPDGYVTADLLVGEEITIKDLLYLLLLPSDNDAANALACAVADNIYDFVGMMNEKAKELGCENTHFVTTNGIHDDDHYTTAREIEKITEAAIKYDIFREIVATPSYVVPGTNMSDQRPIFNTNYLISDRKTYDYIYRYCTGVKTGLTSQAGHCLVSMAEKDGRTVICVIMGTEDYYQDGVRQYPVFNESLYTLAHGLDDFEYKTLVESDKFVQSIPVRYSRDGDTTNSYTTGSITELLPVDADMSEVVMEYTLPEVLDAPIQEGTVYGSMDIYYQGEKYGTVDIAIDTTLSYSHTLELAKTLQNTIGWPSDEQLSEFMESEKGEQLFDFLDMHPSAIRYGMLAIPGAIILILILIIWLAIRRKKKQNDGYKLGDDDISGDNNGADAVRVQAEKAAGGAATAPTADSETAGSYSSYDPISGTTTEVFAVPANVSGEDTSAVAEESAAEIITESVDSSAEEAAEEPAEEAVEEIAAEEMAEEAPEESTEESEEEPVEEIAEEPAEESTEEPVEETTEETIEETSEETPADNAEETSEENTDAESSEENSGESMGESDDENSSDEEQIPEEKKSFFSKLTDLFHRNKNEDTE